MDAIELTTHDARLLRLRAQRLEPGAAEQSALSALRAVVGLQSQSWPATPLGVRCRSHGLLAEDVQRARLEERSVVRSWFMRGTLHLVAAEDVGWLLGLLGPYAIAAGERRRKDLGLDERTYAAGARALEKTLAEGPKTRAEIDAALQRARIAIEPKTQAAIHLIARAALEGRVSYGPDRGAEKELVLIRDWAEIGSALAPDVALVELARRYLDAFAPASPADFAKWSALPMQQCRQAFEQLAPRLAEVHIDAASAWLPRARLADLDALPAEPVARLLGAFDTYLIGYANPKAAVAERYRTRVWNGGLIQPTVILDGLPVATWKLDRKPRDARLTVTPFEPLDPALSPALAAEAEDVSRFLATEVRLSITDA